MFKYISEIIEKFTGPQRMLALLILLFTLTVIYMGPKLIDAATYNDVELKALISTQKTEISVLRSELDSLNDVIVSSQKECTNRAVKREKEILTMVESIEVSIKRSSTEPMKLMMVRKDSIHINKSMVENEPQINLGSYEVMTKINKLKKNIVTNIK